MGTNKLYIIFKNQYFILFCISVLFFIFYLSTIINKSATYDEPIIIASGNHFLRTFDNSINSENPPFLKSLLTLPTLFMDLHQPTPSQNIYFEYGTKNSFKYGNDFLFKNNFKIILPLSRGINIILTIIFAFFVFKTAQLIYKRKIYSYLSFILFLLLPTVIANGRLATLDIGTAMLMFAANYFLLLYFLHQKPKFLFISSIFIALSLLSKFTALLIFPIFILQYLIFIYIKSKEIKIKHLFLFILCLFIIPLVVICIFYFNSNFSFVLLNRNFKSYFITSALNNSLLLHFPVLLPKCYAKGIDIVSYLNCAGNKFTFLGQLYTHGIWYYYIVISLIKIPIPILLFTFTGIYFIVKKYYKTHLLYIFISTPLITFICFSLFTERQLGIRYIILIFPYITLASIYGIKILFSLESKTVHFLISLLVIYFLISDVIVYPNYLTYFNELIGGSSNAYKYFDDSNLDWGQDLPAIKKWITKHNNPKVYVSYFGQTPLELYDIKNNNTSPKYFICSTFNYHRKKHLDNIFNFAPIHIINNSILVFNVRGPKKNMRANSKLNSIDSNFKAMKVSDIKISTNANIEGNKKKGKNKSCDKRYYIEIK